MSEVWCCVVTELNGSAEPCRTEQSARYSAVQCQAGPCRPLPIHFNSSQFSLFRDVQHHNYSLPQKYQINSQNSTDPSKRIIPFPITPSPSSPNPVKSHYLNLPTFNGTSTALTPQTPAPAVTIHHRTCIAPALSSPDSRFSPPLQSSNTPIFSLLQPHATNLAAVQPSILRRPRLLHFQNSGSVMIGFLPPGPMRVQVIPPTDTAKRL